MKEFLKFAVLMLVLPLAFTSCGNDDEPDSFSFVEPYLTWGASPNQVKSAFSSKATFSYFNEDKEMMFFDGKDDNSYEFCFDDNELYESDYFIQKKNVKEQELIDFLTKRYNYVGEEDGVLIFVVNKNTALFMYRNSSYDYFALEYDEYDEEMGPKKVAPKASKIRKK